MKERTHEHAERLDLDGERGLIVSEHRGRYLWAAQLAGGRQVLDVGCGTGYGLGILAKAGARRVVGIDVSEEAVARAASSAESDAIEVHVGDAQELQFADGEFDFAVCFEVIEHVHERDAILDELARVLSPGGFLCISTPNRLVYPPGNPHHIHEYEPDEFLEALSGRFRNVSLRRQTAWLASGILTGEELEATGAEDDLRPQVLKTESKLPGEEIFTIALAGNGALPEPGPVLVLGETFEVRWWQGQVQDAGVRGEQRGREESATELARMAAECDEARREAGQLRRETALARQAGARNAQRLLEVEASAAVSGARVFVLEEALQSQGEHIAEIGERLGRAERVMAEMTASVSWRVTSPLRAVKRLLRGRR